MRIDFLWLLVDLEATLFNFFGSFCNNNFQKCRASSSNLRLKDESKAVRFVVMMIHDLYLESFLQNFEQIFLAPVFRPNALLVQIAYIEYQAN